MAVLCLTLVGVFIFLVLFITPHVFRWYPGLIRGFIFVPHEEIPTNVDYKHPAKAGFLGRNFYLTTKDGVKLGAWHTLPLNLKSEGLELNTTDADNATLSERYDELLANATVFLYLHGSAGTRTSPHRLRLYRLVNQLDYHLVTFDYRGYGDSSGVPLSESDLVQDAMTVFTWLRDRAVNGNIFVWGHSLGTGVGAHLANEIQNQGDKIKGIVLEAPFNNMEDECRVNLMASVISSLPWFEDCFIKSLNENDLAFQSDKHLKNTSVPVLILHAKDDKIIPYSLAEKLCQAVVTSRKDPETVKMIGYERSLGYGHYNITLDPDLNSTVSLFVEKFASPQDISSM
uniref:AB hydrolase-1 domain-containing protein n=1 Tax=Graphocephala atropunctata TaxID=36148 RepID=A0A1B6MDN9_9HEMI